MQRQEITTFIEARVTADGLTETGIPGVRLFRATTAIPCAPAVYEPCIIAIVSGTKEAVLDGERYVYDNSRYMCCPLSMPVKAGTPAASPENPLFGVYIALDQRVMTELVMEMETVGAATQPTGNSSTVQGIKIAKWDDVFSDSLLRLLNLMDSEADRTVLAGARLRELYFAVLKGEAGSFARQAFGVGNAIARSISQMSSDLNAPVSIDELARRAGMSRAAFHRKFKQATTMSPIQFLKSMRLNSAAMKIAGGTPVNQASLEAGYVSSSQFSREFKRMYGQSPRRWSGVQPLAAGLS
ncbi:MAG: AraC family transcriptional regulator [Pseudomonadota bacterium]